MKTLIYFVVLVLLAGCSSSKNTEDSQGVEDFGHGGGLGGGM